MKHHMAGTSTGFLMKAAVLPMPAENPWVKQNGYSTQKGDASVASVSALENLW